MMPYAYRQRPIRPLARNCSGTLAGGQRWPVWPAGRAGLVGAGPRAAGVVRGARGEWLVVRGARGEWLVAGGPMACNAAVGNVVLSGGNNTAMLKDTRIWTSG